MKIFISHITGEVSIASVMKEWIESSFVGQCDVFVSSDKDDIPAGTKWLEEIDKALEDAVALIVLCSPASLSRPWINFETGCGWIKRVPVIPICHSGQKKGALPPPISMFQALELEDKSFVNDLLSSLAKHLGFSKIPRIDESCMKKELVAATAAVESKAVSPPEVDSTTAKSEFPQECIEILKALGKTTSTDITAGQLAASFNMPEQRMQYFLDLLYDKGLINRQLYVMGKPSKYSLKSNGRRYLFEKGLL